jgi:hypothetical protein
MYVYSDNGYSFCSKPDDYVLQAGEVSGPPCTTDTATLTSMFPNYAKGPNLTVNQQLDALNNQYHPQMLALKEDYASAALGNTDSAVTAARQAEIVTEYQTLKTALLAAQEAILNG